MSNPVTPAPSVLCIYGSPRIRGNTDRLLDAFAAGVEEAGGTAQRVYLRNLTISPCREIYACEREGRCSINDDMRPLYDVLRTTDAIVLASPIMFYSVSAHTKAFLDRCQAFWCIKYRRGERVAQHPLLLRKGVFLSVGGSQGAKLFDGALLTMKYFLETVDATLWKSLTYRGIDTAGDIDSHPAALAEAHALGAELTTTVRAELMSAGPQATV
jgi:multimeric flavodoxin WrbA